MLNRVRLIKREEALERERQAVANKEAVQTSVVRTTVENVREWIKEHRAAERVDARQQFAALFS